jgi:hypothetical protein
VRIFGPPYISGRNKTCSLLKAAGSARPRQAKSTSCQLVHRFRKLKLARLSQSEQTGQAFGFGAVHDDTALAAAAAGATFAGHQMAMEGLHAFDLARLGDFDPLGQAFMSLQLRHDDNPTEKKEAAPKSAPESSPKRNL